MDHIARRLALFGAATIGLLTLAACGEDQPAAPTASSSPPAAAESTPSAIPLVSVSGADYSFDAPDTIGGGMTTLRFANKGRESHELRVMRFNEGTSIHQLMQTLHQGEGLDAALRLVSAVGGVESIGPGQTAEATVNLPQAEYVLICLVASPDGVAHASKGMVKPLTVTAVP